MNSKNKNNDSSTEDDAKVYETLAILPSVNELMPHVKSCISLKVRFIIFRIALIQSVLFRIFIQEIQTSQVPVKTILLEERTLLEYFEENKQNLIYKRFDQLDHSKRNLNDRTYFSTLFANFKKQYPRVYFRVDPLFNQKLIPYPNDQFEIDSNFESEKLCAFKREQQCL